MTSEILPGKKASLVIFDKDGTLSKFGAGWTEWTDEVIETFTAKLNKPIGAEFYAHLGWSKVENCWREGLLCDTDANINKGIVKFLVDRGISEKEAEQTAEKHFIVASRGAAGIVPIDDPKAILKTLKAYGIKTAVCTSDNRDGVVDLVEQLDLEGLIDFAHCGDHKDFIPKPDPSNIHYICKALGVDPADTVMVGDSLRDVDMGLRAGVKASVGVLCGCSGREAFKDVEVVVDSVKDVLGIVLPEGFKYQGS